MTSSTAHAPSFMQRKWQETSAFVDVSAFHVYPFRYYFLVVAIPSKGYILGVD